jgi:hypothetical protein
MTPSSAARAPVRPATMIAVSSALAQHADRDEVDGEDSAPNGRSC